MGKLLEYIKLLPEGLKNIDKVFEGVVNAVKMNYGGLTEEEQEIIIKRRLICEGCTFMSKNAVKKGIYNTDRNDEHCIHCGCPIETLTASFQKNCGIEYYNENNPETPLELKWTKIEK